MAGVVLAEAKALGATLEPGALELLLAKIGANSRLLIEEVRKLATYAGAGGAISEAQVAELSPNAAEGDFFEAAEAFASGDLRWTLAAFQRHFFAGGHGRPVIAALQNRNRLLLQVRALLDSGEIRLGPRGDRGKGLGPPRPTARSSARPRPRRAPTTSLRRTPGISASSPAAPSCRPCAA